MLTKMFSLLDIKIGVFNTPFFMIHEGSAVRAVIDLGSDMSTVIARHPADYVLVMLGTFDDQSGIYEPATPAVHLGTVASLLPARAPGSPTLFDSRIPSPLAYNGHVSPDAPEA